MRCGALVGRAKELALGKPQLFGIEVRHPLIEIAVMVYHTSKSIGPIALDPVDHIPAERTAQCADFFAIGPWIFLKKCSKPFL